MFTGLVQALGTVHSSQSNSGGRRLCIRHAGMADRPSIGESVSVNGVCLTVVEAGTGLACFEVGPETLTKTDLGLLESGQSVNLERALRVGDSLGGHFVTGHIDCVGTILDKVQDGDWLTVWFGFPKDFGALLVEKGSIAVDGVSLTVVEVREDSFSVMLIPHTRDNTTLGPKQPGDAVNLEFDLLAKHVRKLLGKG